MIQNLHSPQPALPCEVAKIECRLLARFDLFAKCESLFAKTLDNSFQDDDLTPESF